MNQTESGQELIESIKKAKSSIEYRDQFIRAYMNFVIKNVCEITGKYVKVGDSDELSIALMAFDEAIVRYDDEKGYFLPYSKLVMRSRLLNHFKQIKKHIDKESESLEVLENVTTQPIFESENDLAEEIKNWKIELLKFGITFQKLLEKKPKHLDTRLRAIELSEKISNEQSIVKIMFEKLKLPIQEVHKKINISVKIIQGSKEYIIATVIIFVKRLEALKEWIKKD